MSTPGMYENNKIRFEAQAAATGGALDMSTADIRAAIIDDTDYTANFVTDIDRAEAGIATASVSNLAAGLGTKTFTNGDFNAADDTFTSVSGDGVDSTLVYEHDAIAANAELIVLLDNGGATTPNGNDINVVWAAGPNFIFILD